MPSRTTVGKSELLLERTAFPREGVEARRVLGKITGMVQAAEPYVTYEDYLAAEQAGTTKHEWLDGVVYAMAGGSLEHSRLAGNMHTALKTAFAGCEVFQSDAMLFIRASDLSTYADVTLVCGPVEAQKVERNRKVIGEALINPTVIVEVLSDSTEQYDRGEKFAHYMKLPSRPRSTSSSLRTRRASRSSGGRRGVTGVANRQGPDIRSRSAGRRSASTKSIAEQERPRAPDGRRRTLHRRRCTKSKPK